MSYKLKLKEDVALPGLALPEAFQSLDSRLESVLQLCTAKGSPEAQLVGMVTVCEEMKQLLKCTFIENGMLASRIEILTRYQMESVKKMEKRVNDMDVENRVTRKHMKRLRKKMNAQLVMLKKKEGEWWDVNVRTTDYDSFVTLSRAGGYPDLEFMLRVNQLMIDFVGDSSRTELVLPPMGLEERQEVSKLASIYKLRCRYGKSVQLAPSTLLKARQACVPAAGEVDAILNNFTRTHVQRKATEEVIAEGAKELSERAKPTSIPLPSTMLTPLPNLPSPTVDITSLRHPSPHSPPNAPLPSSSSDGHSAAARFLKHQQHQQRRESTGSATGGEGTSGTRPSSSSVPLSTAMVDRKSSTTAQSSSETQSSSGTPSRPEPPRSQAQEGRKGGKMVKETGLLSHTSTESRSTSSTSMSTGSTSFIPGVVPPSIGTGKPAPLTTKPPFTPTPQAPPTHATPSSPHHGHAHHQHPLSPIGIVLTSSSVSPGGSRSPGGGVLVQSQIRGTLGSAQHTRVLALPIKCHPPLPPSPSSSSSSSFPLPVAPESQQSRNQRRDREREAAVGKKRGSVAGEIRGRESGGGEEGEGDSGGSGLGEGSGGSARTDSMGPPVKRVRVTRRTAAEEEQGKM